MNHQIRAKEVRVIDEEGKQVGIKPFWDALKLAQSQYLDLVEIAPGANPPVCKIIDYTKYKYTQERKERLEKKKQKGILSIKEIRIRPRISEHDLEVKLNHIYEFLEERHKVKITIMFSGREMVHQETGYKILGRIKEKIAPIGETENIPKLEGNRLITLVVPIKK